MHGARWRKRAGGERRTAACRWKFANLAAISRLLWIRYRCRSSRTHSLPLPLCWQQPRAAVRPSTSPPPLSRLPRCLSRVVVRDPRLTRARPLFSTRRSFVDAVLFVIPFVIPLPLFVARRHAPRCLTLSLSNRESRPIKPGGSFEARARARAIETTDAPITARVTNEYALLTIDVYPKSIHARNVADSFWRSLSDHRGNGRWIL